MSGTRDASAANEWQGPVNGILYCVQFRPALDGGEVARVAEMILLGHGLPGGFEVYAPAIRAALAQAGPVDTFIGTTHDDGMIRNFLAQLLIALEAGRSGAVDPPTGR